MTENSFSVTIWAMFKEVTVMVYMFLAEGFEEIEALCPLDLLRRAGVDVKTVGISSKTICGAHGISVIADMVESEMQSFDADMIILPGGMPGTLNLDASKTVHKAIDPAIKNGSYIAAICAAPSILGGLGILRGKEAICYPGFEEKLLGAKISDTRVVVDGKVITAAGMGVALDFGLVLVELLCGKEKAEALRRGVIAD